MRQRVFQAGLWVALVGVILAIGPVSARATEPKSGVGGQRYAAVAIDHSQHDMQELRTGSPSLAARGELIGNLGNHHHPITIASEQGQKFFDEGLILTFGFNHAEAIRSYQDAIALDPACAMCYWGIALALGPNINAPMDPSAVPDAVAALQKAQELAPNVSPAEQAYIKALGQRYSADPDADRDALDHAYADAMRVLSKQLPDDLDAATLFAEALMDLSPWRYWTRDGQATEYTPEIVATLESVMKRAPDHPGANHYYIHAVEASQTPDRALPSAQLLEKLVPGAGHLTHMPAHVYWRVGQYADAGRVNETAIQVDEATFRRGVTGADQGSHSFYSLAYYPHNIHFLFAASHMSGKRDLALASARKLVSVIPEPAFREVPALEDFRPMPLFAMVRFGMWDEILAEPQPPDDMQYTTGIWHWARGLALLRTGQPEAADKELTALETIAKTDAMKELSLASFPKAATLLELASDVLGGELFAGQGRTNEAVMQIQAAVDIQDDLAYTEPPAWFYPVRHNLGAVLLEANRAADAEAVYREDLRQYPNNGWSLLGLSKALRAQGRATDAEPFERKLTEVWKDSQVMPSASRY